jgi:hypothetical protein
MNPFFSKEICMIKKLVMGFALMAVIGAGGLFVERTVVAAQNSNSSMMSKNNSRRHRRHRRRRRHNRRTSRKTGNMNR